MWLGLDIDKYDIIIISRYVSFSLLPNTFFLLVCMQWKFTKPEQLDIEGLLIKILPCF